MLLRSKKILEQASSKLWGVVLNKAELNVIYGASKYYKHYAKYYGKGERHRQRPRHHKHKPKNDEGANSHQD
jgi:hypothetical protein